MDIHETPDEVTITLPPAGWRQKNRPLAAIAIVGGVVSVFLAIGVWLLWLAFVARAEGHAIQARTPDARVFICIWTAFAAGMWFLIMFALVVPWFLAAIRPVQIHVREGRLSIRGIRPRRRQTMIWSRDDLRSIIGHSGGLSLISARWRAPLMAERDEAELQQVAAVLQRALNVPGDWPLEPGEIFATVERLEDSEGTIVADTFAGGVRATCDELTIRQLSMPANKLRFRVLPRDWRWLLPMRGISLPRDGIEILSSVDRKLRIKFTPGWPTYLGAFVLNGDHDDLTAMLRPFREALEAT